MHLLKPEQGRLRMFEDVLMSLRLRSNAVTIMHQAAAPIFAFCHIRSDANAVSGGPVFLQIRCAEAWKCDRHRCCMRRTVTVKQLVKLHAVTNVHNAAGGEAEGIVYYHVFDVTCCVCVPLSCHGSNRFGIPYRP